MSPQTMVDSQKAGKATFTPTTSGLLQRTCDCGQHIPANSVECEECKKKRQAGLQHKAIQPSPVKSALLNAAAPGFAHDFSEVSASSAARRAEPSPLKINRPNDKYEQEAHQVARQVLDMPDPGKKHQEVEDRKKKDEEASQNTPSISKTATGIQRWVSDTYDPEEEIRQQFERLGVYPAVASQIASALHALRGNGQPVPDSLRGYFEAKLGIDLSPVRLHIGSVPAQLAQMINAKAFTLGQDIVFGAGEYSPDTPAGKLLLAHELIHTVQQNGWPNPAIETKQSSQGMKDEGTGVVASPRQAPQVAKSSVTKPSQSKEASTTDEKTKKEAKEALSKQDSSSTQAATQVADAAAPGENIPEKAPASPEEDRAYKAVVDQMGKKAKQQKTPPKVRASKVEDTPEGQIKVIAKETSERKKGETELAAELPEPSLREQTNKVAHLDQVAAKEKEQPELTVAGFMDTFGKTVEKLGDALPADRKENDSIRQLTAMQGEKIAAKQDLAKESQAASEPLHTEVKNDPFSYQDPQKQESKPHELKVDPPGGTPVVKDANAAAPKPKTDAEISLEDKSRSLDDSLANHNVNGQTINIDEGSLAFPVSGEKSFDEAGEAKRQAQDEIEKTGPRYREEEAAVIGKTEKDMHSLVHTGFKQQHGFRSSSFKNVLGTQKSQKSKIETEKLAAFNTFQKIYDDTNTKVQAQFKRLEGIQGMFETIISEAEKRFNSWVRQDLEYIYTPGFWDYSDWIDKPQVKAKIREEYKKLIQQGESHWTANSRSVELAREASAKELFERAKQGFINEVRGEVETKIANVVVEVLSAAKGHIRKGKSDTEAEFKKLDPKVKNEVQQAYKGAIDKYEVLEESVDERQSEIINDMAQAYNKSVGKLQATFDTIKKDVLTSWWEKAWNKLKEVVNAIIDFATRIAELLGRLVHLVGDIIASPRAFFSNLVSGIGQGFSRFVDQIDVFLATAFFDWLRGSSGLPIQLPKSWSPEGIFSMFTQLLGLTTETVWQRMDVVYNKTIANAFRRGEVLLEQGLEIFAIVRNEGLGGLWNHIKESLGSMLDETLATIKETVLYAAIKRVIIEIGKMLIPGGGFIAIAEKVVRLLQFLVEARDKILDLIESFVDSVEMAVKGNVPGIVNHITKALTKFITIALDFLVTLFGLGKLKEKVERILARVRKPIVQAIDWVLNKLKPPVLRVFAMVTKGGSKEKGQRKQLDEEETKDAAKPEKQEKAEPDIALAKQTVRQALDSQLPEGASQDADVEKVLAGVAPKVKPALTNLRAEELMPGKPKTEGAIGFTVRAKLAAGKDAIIDKVKFSQKGKVLSHEERWQAGVKGVKRAVAQLEKRKISEETIKAQFPRWQSEFGFTALLLNAEQTPWVIEGEMSPGRVVTAVRTNYLQEAKSNFKKRLFAPEELKEATSIGIQPARKLISTWLAENKLFELKQRAGDNLTPHPLYSFNRKRAEITTYGGQREFYGYRNPAKASKAGLTILSRGLVSAPPIGDKKPYSLEYHLTQAIYKSWKTSTRFGYADAILGHGLGASHHWNQIGHKRTKEQNQAYNLNVESYGGPEYKPESDASGEKASFYRVPAKISGSNDEWLD